MAGAARVSAATRILDAARQLVARGGAADVTMGDVAAAAGVSKALVHYHFHDKDTLLTAVVEQVGSEVLARARRALDGPAAEHTLDAHWARLDAELRAGDIRTLLALAECDRERVRDASRRVATQRRDVQARQTAALFDSLGLTMRLPAELVAETIVAFVDGLALAHALEPDRASRPAFDVLWLALLTLAE
jgi:AcrR family transcriptional regulator